MTTAAVVMAQLVEKLKAEPEPMAHGRGLYYRSMVPAKTPDQLLEIPDESYTWMYAEALREFVAVLEAKPVQPFVDKRNK